MATITTARMKIEDLRDAAAWGDGPGQFVILQNLPLDKLLIVGRDGTNTVTPADPIIYDSEKSKIRLYDPINLDDPRDPRNLGQLSRNHLGVILTQGQGYVYARIKEMGRNPQTYAWREMIRKPISPGTEATATKFELSGKYLFEVI